MNFVFIGSLFGLFAVAMGAFGAHLLGNRRSADDLRIWEMAVRYNMYHALALIAVGLVEEITGLPQRGWLELSGGLMQGGMVVFSGALYLLVLSGRRWLGAAAPVGGLLLIGGWLVLAGAVWQV